MLAVAPLEVGSQRAGQIGSVVDLDKLQIEVTTRCVRMRGGNAATRGADDRRGHGQREAQALCCVAGA